MGVLRDSPMTISMLSECSQINPANLYEEKEWNRTYSYDYFLGYSIIGPWNAADMTPINENTTFRYWTQIDYLTLPTLRVISYPSKGRNPVQFLLRNLDTKPNGLDEGSSPCDLDLVWMESQVNTTGYNSDPFFQTQEESMDAVFSIEILSDVATYTISTSHAIRFPSRLSKSIDH